MPFANSISLASLRRAAWASRILRSSSSRFSASVWVAYAFASRSALASSNSVVVFWRTPVSRSCLSSSDESDSPVLFGALAAAAEPGDPLEGASISPDPLGECLAATLCSSCHLLCFSGTYRFAS